MDEYFDGLSVTGDLRRVYTERALEALADGDGRLCRARDEWAQFVSETTGNPVGDLSATAFRDAPVDASPLDRTFVLVQYYDFLVDCLIDAVEGTTGVELGNRDPSVNTADVETALGVPHDHVIPPSAGRDRVTAALASDELTSMGPASLGVLYRAVVPQQVRLALGEYYTPPGVAALAVASLPTDIADARVLDPGCGAGAFLTAAIDAKRRAFESAGPAETVDAVVDSVVGIDLNPVAVKSAKLAYLLALADELRAADRTEVAVPVFLTDALGLTREDALVFEGARAGMEFDALVGNPPWVPWERVPDDIKQAWRREYVDELGLQPHEGIEARLGHSNDDVSIPYAFTCIHRYLRAGGAAAFVLKRDAVRGPAGAVLRGRRVGDRPLRVTRVNDFARLDPFTDAAANAAVYTFRADTEPRLPIPTTVWRERDGVTPSFESLAAVRDTLDAVETELVSLDDDRTSPWVRADLADEALGECRHDVRHGLKDDAAAVFGLDRATLDRVETDRVYPYLRSRHVRPFGLTGHDLRLVPADQAGADNEAWLREACPKTYAYLEEHRETLRDRSSSWLDAGPFYTQFGLGPYTWAPYKVVWCRLGFKPAFAVASTRSDPDLGEKLVVPGDHYMFVATDDRREAHFLCALLNSAPYQRTLRTLASGGKASLSKAVVSELALPSWPGTERAEELARCSIALHDLVNGDGEPDEAERERLRAEVDRLVRAGIEAGEFGTGSTVAD